MNFCETIPEMDMKLTALTSYIVNRYHDDLRRRLPELIQLALTVEHDHAENPDCPKGLHEELTSFFCDMENHMHIEETIHFPMINSGKENLASLSVDKLLMEEDACKNQLREIRMIGKNYKVPKDASSAWISLYVGLEKLEQELEEHIHLEESILYPIAQKLVS